MPQQLILKLTNYWYDVLSSTDEEIECLGLYLRNRSGLAIALSKRFAGDPSSDWSTGNISTIEKEGEEIFLGFIIFEPGDLRFAIDIKNFIQLMDEFKEMCWQKPKKIIITKKGGVITVGGNEFPEEGHSFFDKQYWPDSISLERQGNFNLEMSGAYYGFSWSLIEDEWLKVFAGFLAYDLGWYGAERYRKWLQDDLQKEISGDLCFIKKIGDFIVIKDVDRMERGIYFAIAQGQFIKLLDDWEKLWRVKPKKIQVSCKNGDVTFTPEYEWQEA